MNKPIAKNISNDFNVAISDIEFIDGELTAMGASNEARNRLESVRSAIHAIALSGGNPEDARILRNDAGDSAIGYRINDEQIQSLRSAALQLQEAKLSREDRQKRLGIAFPLPQSEAISDLITKVWNLGLRADHHGLKKLQSGIAQLTHAPTERSVGDNSVDSFLGKNESHDIYQAFQRAYSDLPQGYGVVIELEAGAAGVAWYDEVSNRHIIEGRGVISDDINEAVETALRAMNRPTTEN